MELSENLRRLRQENGLSQEELADKLGVSRQAVSRWEVGTAVPATDNLIFLSRMYRVSVDELLFPGKARPEEFSKNEGEQERTPRKRKSHGKMQIFLIAYAVFCGALLIWGKLTKSMGSVKTFLVYITFLLLLGLFVYTLFRILRYLDYKEK